MAVRLCLTVAESKKDNETSPPCAETQPQLRRGSFTVSRRLTAMCGGRAAEVANPVFKLWVALVLFLCLGGSHASSGHQKRSMTSLTAIASYTKAIDQFTKRNPRKMRIFGIIPGEENKPDHWAEFETIRQEVQANLEDSAHVWARDGKVVVAEFSLTSSSGDWYHYVNYYFHTDGTL